MKYNFKGTPGEWIEKDGAVYCDTVRERGILFGDPTEDGEIAQCWQSFHSESILPEEECLANARMISAAPKMFECLKLVREFLILGDTTLSKKIIEIIENNLNMAL